MIFRSQVKIEILPQGRVISARKGDSLHTLLLVNRVLAEGQEAVRLEIGSMSPSAEPQREEERFSSIELADGWMLASGRKLEGDAVLYVPQPQGQDGEEEEPPAEPINQSQLAGLAMALDLGSGTVAAGISALPGLAIPAVSARVNRQCELFGDMGKRLKFLREDEQGLAKLQQLLYDDIEQLALRLADKTGLNPAEIRLIMVAANTSLGQMLWGEQPSLPAGAAAPWRMPQERLALNTPLAKLMPQAKIVLMPAAHADIGSDIVSAALAAGLKRKIDNQQITLLIDLGLSTEIVAAGRGRLLAVSVSTPALEGVSVACGMRATAGAIVKVRIRDTVRLTTVRDGRPRGVSGAGLLSAAYALLSTGLLSADGRIVFDRDLPPRLLAHFTRGLEGGEFLLSRREGSQDIVIGQNDIRQLQLAKGNLYAACRAVLAEMCVTEQDIEQILIGESFGAHIEPPAALALGLVPQVAPEKVRAIGNAAWQGAFLCLGDKSLLAEAERLAARMERLDLAANTVYAAAFLPAMEFAVEE
jgi:uncharacterized 2Fe-2S/4Fe-4S cluster protein (DUF4445 family)